MFHNTNKQFLLSQKFSPDKKMGKLFFCYLGNGQWQTNKFPLKNRETLTRYLSTLKKKQKENVKEKGK